MTELRATVARYLIVGGGAYLIEMVALYVLRHIFLFSPLLSVAISFWIGFVVAFIMQKFITFQNYERRANVITKQIISYSLLVAWNYLFTLVTVQLLSHRLSVFVIRTGVIIIVTFWNFYLYRTIIFKNTDNVLVE